MKRDRLDRQYARWQLLLAMLGKQRRRRRKHRHPRPRRSR